MIAVRPDNEAGRLLARLVAEPGELTAEALAELLHPEPRHQGAFSAATYKVHVAALRAHRDAADKRRTTVSALLHRLQQVGLVEKIRQVHVAPGFERVAAKRTAETLHRLQQLAAVERSGPAGGLEQEAARRGNLDALRLAQPDDDADEARARDLSAHLIVLDLVRSAPGSAALRAGLAEGGGWRWKVYGELGDWGVLVTPARRWPSAKGVALVEGWRA